MQSPCSAGRHARSPACPAAAGAPASTPAWRVFALPLYRSTNTTSVPRSWVSRPSPGGWLPSCSTTGRRGAAAGAPRPQKLRPCPARRRPGARRRQYTRLPPEGWGGMHVQGLEPSRSRSTPVHPPTRPPRQPTCPRALVSRRNRMVARAPRRRGSSRSASARSRGAADRSLRGGWCKDRGSGGLMRALDGRRARAGCRASCCNGSSLSQHAFPHLPADSSCLGFGLAAASRAAASAALRAPHSWRGSTSASPRGWLCGLAMGGQQQMSARRTAVIIKLGCTADRCRRWLSRAPALSPQLHQSQCLPQVWQIAAVSLGYE